MPCCAECLFSKTFVFPGGGPNFRNSSRHYVFRCIREVDTLKTQSLPHKKIWKKLFRKKRLRKNIKKALYRCTFLKRQRLVLKYRAPPPAPPSGFRTSCAQNPGGGKGGGRGGLVMSFFLKDFGRAWRKAIEENVNGPEEYRHFAKTFQIFL